jgi:hypothetical protein
MPGPGRVCLCLGGQQNAQGVKWCYATRLLGGPNRVMKHENFETFFAEAPLPIV